MHKEPLEYELSPSWTEGEREVSLLSARSGNLLDYQPLATGSGVLCA